MTVLVAVIAAAIDIYLAWRTSHAISGLPVKNKKLWNKFPYLFFSSFFIFPISGLIQYYGTGHIDVLGYYKPVVYWFWFGFVFSVQLFTWVVIADVVQVVLRISGKWEHRRLRRLFHLGMSGMVLVVMIFTAVKMYSDTTRIELNRTRFTVDDLPAEYEGLKIVHISDLQADEYVGREELSRYKNIINRLEPDLVVFTGDLISYGTGYLELAVEELSGIRSRYGTYAVVGDHDFWAGLQHVEPALEAQNIPLLRDTSTSIALDDSLSIHLTGITNVYSKQADRALSDSLIAGFDRERSLLSILATHQVSPYMVNRAGKEQYGLVLGGHTHGGQLRVPLFWNKLSASNLETKYIQGTYRENGVLININNGLGFTLAPVRYNAPASISVIELTAG